MTRLGYSQPEPLGARELEMKVLLCALSGSDPFNVINLVLPSPKSRERVNQ
ncbi:MAG: hypothetical protein JWM11_4022 [Planctomycetaceae bacterium]|nr:hypothetical protein [Planctomycetaceae bacterium]